MKKIIRILLIIAMLITVSAGIVFAESKEVTKDGLEQALITLLSENESEDTYNVLISDEQILIYSDTKSYALNYNLDEDTKFYVDMNFKSSMTNEEIEKMLSQRENTMFGFMAVATINEVEYGDIISYTTSTLIADENNQIELDQSKNGLEYAKDFMLQVTPETENDLFTTTYEVLEDTPESYSLRKTITIKSSADFSTIIGFADKLLPDYDEEIPNVNDGPTEIIDEITGNEETNEKANEETEKNDETTQIPNAGNDGNIMIAVLAGVITISVLAIIVIAIKSKKNGKSND